MVTRPLQPLDRAAWEWVQERANERGLNRNQLAELAGIPYQTVRGWYESTTGPKLSLADLIRFAEGLGVSGVEAYEQIQRRAIAIEQSAD